MFNLLQIKNHKIDKNPMNRGLTGLYSNMPRELNSTISSYNESVSDIFISNPFLLSVSDTYFSSKYKVMIIGQETYCWFGERNEGIYSASNPINELMNLYDLFVNNPSRNYNSPFWQYVNDLTDLATQHNIGLIINNLAKIGFNKGVGYNTVINAYFDCVFREEIRICNPNMILFLSGPNYDSLIRERLGDFSITDCIPGIPQRKFGKLFFEDEYLNKIEIYRTYHPGYLRRVRNKSPWVTQIDQYIHKLLVE